MSTAPPPQKLTTVHWLICIIASIGFAFDIYELLMLPLVIKTGIPALAPVSSPEELAQWLPGSANFTFWARTLFFVPAIAGGVFGLLGGYLTDILGRRRVLTWSIVLYAGSACAAGFAQSLPQLLVCRCLVFVGVCVEFVAAVAWLAELFPNPVQREKVLGYTQAFSSLGGILVAAMNHLASDYAEILPAIYGGHEAWRYTLISGLIPALPLIIIRPFLPESPVWASKRAAGTLKRPSLTELFSPQLRLTTIVTTLAFATTFGLAFGAIQQNPQILTGHVDLKAEVTKAQDLVKQRAAEAGKEPTPRELGQAKGNASDKVTAGVQAYQEFGGLFGRVLLAILTVQIVSRRALFRVFQIPSLLFVPALYWWISQNMDTVGSLDTFKIAMFVAGAMVVGQMSFWGNYIPRVFPVHLRGTGESFAANIGGRVLGTAAAWITLTLSQSSPPNPAKIAIVGAGVAGAYALIGFVLTFLLPEPLPEEPHEG